ncbi:MAG: beta-galactosidase [Chloroflexi bacterium]|nr:beta-galactosidase [Chloroflexota bacterium]
MLHNVLSRLVRLVLILIALGALAGLSSTVSAWMVADSPAPAPLPPRLIPDTDVNPYGANFFLDREVEDWKRDRTVRMAHDAGIVWAKQQFAWEDIEKRKNQFDWTKYDQIVATFEKYGLQIIARLDRPPAWAHKDNTIPQGPPDDYADYGDFVDAFVRRYQGRIHFIQVWNEPNIYPEWGNQPVDPSAYVQLLKVAYTRAKAADPTIRILSAPLAITTPGEPWAPGSSQWRAMDDLAYLDAMYKDGAKSYFDILSANAFGLSASPDDPPDPSKLNFERVALDRQTMVKYNDANKAVWINEYGWNASPSDFTVDKLTWGRVTEQQQADYTVNGIRDARDKWPWIGVFNIWYFRQVGDITPDRSDYYFRMVDVDFTPRLVYLRLKDAATFPAVAEPGQFQETDPSVSLTGSWLPYLNAASSGGRELVTRQPGARASIRFWGDGIQLLMRRGATLGRAWITLDGKPVDDLPLDSNGNSYVELSSPNDEYQVHVPVAQDLTRGTHTVEVVVGQSGEVSLDGFVVDANGLHEFPWLFAAGFAGVLVFALLLFLLSLLRGRRHPTEENTHGKPASA